MDSGFIERLREAKKRKKMTQEELAEATGIAGSTLAKILANLQDDIKLSNAVGLAKALDVSLSYLVYGEEADELAAKSPDRMRLLHQYASLDSYGRTMVDEVLRLEYTRNQESTTIRQTIKVRLPVQGTALESRPSIEKDARTSGSRRIIPFYTSLRASAGRGQYLDEDFAGVEEISIPDVERTRDADMAVQIAGNSMEPKYHNGDILLVRQGGELQIGDLGLFSCDGEAYFKVFDGERLLSLNKLYDPIPLSRFNEVYCFGKIIGRLKN